LKNFATKPFGNTQSGAKTDGELKSIRRKARGQTMEETYTFGTPTKTTEVLSKIQNLIRSALVLGEPMLKRHLMRKVHADRYGTRLWGSGYNGLVKAGVIRESGEGTKESPVMVTLLVSNPRDEAVSV
jgi:hypothetical protein